MKIIHPNKSNEIQTFLEVYDSDFASLFKKKLVVKFTYLADIFENLTQQ